MMKLLVLILYLLNVVNNIKSEFGPLVHTAHGSLQGKITTSRSGKNLRAFLGIPFAAPPVGPLRFMPPQPPGSWEGVRNATEEGKPCIQLVPGGQEDCLYLNVFNGKTANENQSLPVMVFIHGGGFYGGSASPEVYGPEYFMDKNIVLVTIQYRLGVFGFMSNEDDTIPGNQGLKDQRRALQWVQENIAFFGGDPSKVTIFGNSAGSSSVHLHMISPKSKDLFARAISQSGTALSAFSLIGKGTSKNITRLLAENLKCPTNNSLEILHCLQNQTADIIQQEYSKLQHEGYEIRHVLYRPIVEIKSDHAFLTETPLTTTSDKPWLVGIVQNEGLWKIHIPSLNKTKHLIQTEYHKFLPDVLFFEDTCSKPSEVAEKIYNFYFKNNSTDNDTITSIEHMISDSYFIWPTFQAIVRHKGPAYCYLFAHRGEHSFTEPFQAPKGFGVSHMDELLYLFPHKKLFPGVKNEEDANISKLLIDLWVNFATEGNPTPSAFRKNPQIQGNEKIIWEPSASDDVEFLKIQTEMLSMVKNIFPQRMALWNSLPIRDKIV